MVAYHHPKAIQKITPYIYGVFFLILVVGLTWNVAKHISYTRLLPFIDDSKLDKAASVAGSVEFPIWAFLLIGFGVPILIRVLTDFVGNLKGDGSEKEDEQKGSGKSE